MDSLDNYANDLYWLIIDINNTMIIKNRGIFVSIDETLWHTLSFNILRLVRVFYRDGFLRGIACGESTIASMVGLS